MTNSLRDQLLKAGLVSQKQLQKNRPKPAAKGKQRKQARSEEERQREAELRALSAHKKARDRELNEQRNRQREAQEQAEWVRQLIGAHAQARQPAAEGAAAFHFTLDGKIHHLYLSEAQRGDLSAGRSGIVRYDGQYHLLPQAQAQKIHERLGRRVWLASLVEEQGATAPDDPYADYQVPDDLMW